MSTILTTPRRVKSTAFGAGILEPEPVALEIRDRFYLTTTLPTVGGVAVVRVAAMDDASAVYDVSRGPDALVRCTCADFVWKREGKTAEPCKHGRAAVEAGLIEAPAPVANPARPAPVALDGIPAGVTLIRLTAESVADGTFRRAGDQWARETDGRTNGGAVADREYPAGRLAILADAPAPTPTPEAADEGDVESDPSTWPAWTDERWTTTEPAPSPAPIARVTTRRGPSTVDLAFEAGRSIALDCEGPAEPPAHYTPVERSAFLAGLAEGAAIDHAREVEHLNDVAMQAEADELLSDGVPCW